MKDQIKSALGVLINARLTEIRRALDMEMFHFTSKDVSGPQYALHAQCAWRITGPEGILVGYQDRFYPGGPDPFRDLDDFDPDGLIVNRCDERIASFLKKKTNRELNVLEIEADEVGSLSIRFSNGVSIDLFPFDTIPGEYWRFFEINSNKSHFVVTSEGISD